MPPPAPRHEAPTSRRRPPEMGERQRVCAARSSALMALVGGRRRQRRGRHRKRSPPPSLISGLLAVAATAVDVEAFGIGDGFICGIAERTHLPECWGVDADRRVSGAPRQALVALSVHNTHACGITGDTREPLCWGSPAAYSGMPPRGTELSFIAAGDRHTCGIAALSRKAICWGAGGPSCGAGAVERATADAEFVAIAVGETETCGIQADSQTALCWDACAGEAGRAASPPPQRRFTAIAVGGGGVACGLEVGTSTPVCWGQAVVVKSTPTDTAMLSIDARGTHVCGIRRLDGSPVCWGVDVEVLRGPLPQGGELLMQIAVGRQHACGLGGSGQPICWGHGAPQALQSRSGRFSWLPSGHNVDLQWWTLAATVRSLAVDTDDNETGGDNNTGASWPTTLPPRSSNRTWRITTTLLTAVDMVGSKDGGGGGGDPDADGASSAPTSSMDAVRDRLWTTISDVIEDGFVGLSIGFLVLVICCCCTCRWWVMLNNDARDVEDAQERKKQAESELKKKEKLLAKKKQARHDDPDEDGEWGRWQDHYWNNNWGWQAWGWNQDWQQEWGDDWEQQQQQQPPSELARGRSPSKISHGIGGDDGQFPRRRSRSPLMVRVTTNPVSPLTAGGDGGQTAVGEVPLQGTLQAPPKPLGAKPSQSSTSGEAEKKKKRKKPVGATKEPSGEKKDCVSVTDSEDMVGKKVSDNSGNTGTTAERPLPKDADAPVQEDGVVAPNPQSVDDHKELASDEMSSTATVQAVAKAKTKTKKPGASSKVGKTATAPAKSVSQASGRGDRTEASPTKRSKDVRGKERARTAFTSAETATKKPELKHSHSMPASESTLAL